MKLSRNVLSDQVQRKVNCGDYQECAADEYSRENLCSSSLRCNNLMNVLLRGICFSAVCYLSWMVVYSAVCYHRCNCCDKHLQVPTATIRCLLGGWRGLEGAQSGRRSPQSSPNSSILPTVDYAPCQRPESYNLQPIVA